MAISNKPWYGQRIGHIVDGEVYFNDEFMRFIDALVEQSGLVSWDTISKAGSSLSDLSEADHSVLSGIDGAVAGADENKNKHVSNAQAQSWDGAITDLDTHEGLTSAHGATGNIVGRGDFATTALAGVVQQATALNNAGGTEIFIASGPVEIAPGAWETGWGNDVAALVNELRLDVETLAGDVNDLTSTVNQLLARMRTAGLMDS